MAEQFHLGVGGPLHRVENATHLYNFRRIVLAAIALTWVPLLVLSLIQWLVIHRTEPMLRDLSIHVRLLITLPLLLFAERLLDVNCRTAVGSLFEEGFVPVEKHDGARAILRQAERARASSVPETVLFAVALAAGLASLVGILPPSGIVHGLVAESRYSAARVWYALVALPISQFVLWRSLFHWVLWVRVLAGLSRLRLRLLAAHADRRGGIGFLRLPSLSYGAVLLLAVSCALCGGWGTQMVLYGTKIDAIKPLFIAFVLIGSIIAFAPLVLFVPMLFSARRRGRIAYGGLMSDYSRRVDERWIDRSGRADLLGSPDFQSLADLSTTYRENVEKMQVILFELRDCIVLFVVALIPAIPLLLSQLPAREVLKRLLHLFTGGMPG
jgi:hypothetical protein